MATFSSFTHNRVKYSTKQTHLNHFCQLFQLDLCVAVTDQKAAHGSSNVVIRWMGVLVERCHLSRSKRSCCSDRREELAACRRDDNADRPEWRCCRALQAETATLRMTAVWCSYRPPASPALCDWARPLCSWGDTVVLLSAAFMSLTQVEVLGSRRVEGGCNR